jgi:hypothetical protein
MRIAAASATGVTAICAIPVSDQNSRIPQKPLTKNRPAGIKAPMREPATITCRQSSARSAIRPTTRLSTSIASTGTALMTPISPSPRPFSASQMPP